MLDTATQSQLRAYFERITQPIELVASLDDRPASAEMRELLGELAELAPGKIGARFDGDDARRPSFSINRVGAGIGVRFAAIPMGHEFTSLVLALLQAGGHPPKVEAEVIEQIQGLEGDFVFETYMSLTCHNCPDVVQALNLMAVLNPRVRHVAIDGGLFQPEVEARQVMVVPSVYLNGQPFGTGRMELAEILAKVDSGSAEREAAKLAEKAPYDMLVVGGGPAGAAAAIYAARKGIRTGVVAERFGGQVLDTLAIENFISVKETEGPKFAAALEQHVRTYDVDIMNNQRAEKLVPAAEPGGLVEVQMANGASLAQRQRARRGRVQEQGCGLLPALRRPAVQGQARRGDRRRQLRCRSSDRPGRCRAARDAAGVRRCAARRRGVGHQAQELAERHRAHAGADHRNHRRRPEGQRPGLRGPRDRPVAQSGA
jgi:alkyl hydroperoxide reductase subunit F